MGDKIQRWFGKFVVFVFTLEAALYLLSQGLRRITSFELCVAFAVISLIAFFILKHRHPSRKSQRPSGGGERTPVMPRRNP